MCCVRLRVILTFLFKIARENKHLGLHHEAELPTLSVIRNDGMVVRKTTGKQAGKKRILRALLQYVGFLFLPLRD